MRLFEHRPLWFPAKDSDSLLDHGVPHAKVRTESFERCGDTSYRKKFNIPFISGLVLPGSPPNIPRHITFGIVDALYRKAVRALTQVGKEILERAFPSFTYSDASATIILVSVHLWIVATVLHVVPSMVSAAPLTSERSGVTVALGQGIRFFQQTPTGSGVSSSETSRCDFRGLAAFAQAANHSHAITTWSVSPSLSDNFKSSKNCSEGYEWFGHNDVRALLMSSGGRWQLPAASFVGWQMALSKENFPRPNNAL